MRFTLRRLAGATLLLVSLAVAIDRCSLWIWRWRINRFFTALRTEAERDHSQRRADWTQNKWYALNLSNEHHPTAKQSLYPVAYLEVVLDRPGGVKPSDVIVDGAGGLHLRYFPPLAVWSIRLRHLWSRPDKPVWLALYEQSYSIDIQWYGEFPSDPLTHRPYVGLVHGVPGH
jgi:hypothetical protein